MKKILLFCTTVLLIFTLKSCSEGGFLSLREPSGDSLPLYQAKGYVLGVTQPCEGNALLIEVTNPKGIGKKGSFTSSYGLTGTWNYENAVRVPRFEKLNMPVELMQEGTFLHFEYREYNSDNDSDFFAFDTGCTADKFFPVSTTYVITKIISYKLK